MRFGMLVVLAGAWGCSAKVGGPEQRVTTDPANDPVPEEGASRLEILGDAEVSVAKEMSIPLRVSYTDAKGNPVSGQVSFAFDGDAAGATFPSRAIQTDEEGIGDIEMRAGSEEAELTVVASADLAAPVRWTVTVTTAGSGDLEIVPSPQGSVRLNAADVYLYEDPRACEDIDPLAPPPADRIQSTASLREHPRFSALPAGSVWTALVLGIGEAGHPMASGCVTGATVVGGEEVVVEVPLQDVPLRMPGAFSVESHFLVTDGLPQDARNTLDVLSEIADDPDDPATFFLDQLGEAIDDGAIEFAWSLARDMTGLDRTVNDIILDYTPDIIWDVLEAAGDVTALLEDVQVESRITLTEQRAEDGTVSWTARHELIDLVLELDGVTHRYPVAEAVGIRDSSVDDIPVVLEGDDQVRIGSHAFRVGLGTLARFALNEIVLPQLPGRPDSLAELVRDALPCDDIGEELSYAVGVGSDSFWGGVCETAGAMLGQYLEASILSLDDRFDRLELEGVADLEDATLDRTIDKLEDGNWNSALTGGAGRFPIPGTFTGAAEPQSSTR